MSNQPHSMSIRGAVLTPPCLSPPVSPTIGKGTEPRTRDQLPSSPSRYKLGPVSIRGPFVTMGSVKGRRGCLLSSLREEALELGTRELSQEDLADWGLTSTALGSHSPV